MSPNLMGIIKLYKTSQYLELAPDFFLFLIYLKQLLQKQEGFYQSKISMPKIVPGISCWEVSKYNKLTDTTSFASSV